MASGDRANTVCFSVFSHQLMSRRRRPSPTFLKTYVWAIGNYNSTQDTVDTRLCQDEDGTDAASTHPAEVAAWLCDGSGSTTTATAEDDDYTGFTVWCGCTTPAPTGTDGLRDFTLSPAPIALAAEEVEDISEDDGSEAQVVCLLEHASSWYIMVPGRFTLRCARTLLSACPPRLSKHSVTVLGQRGVDEWQS